MSTAAIRFPLQFVGGVSLPRTVTVTNTGGGDITVSPVLTGDPEFTIAGSSCPNPLPSGQSCAVGVQFTPVIDGSRLAVLTIGNSTVQLSAQGEITSAVRVSPLQLNFVPTVVHLDNETFAVALTNTQAAAVPISSIVFSQPDYTETDDCAGQVPAGASCTVQVTFTPQALGQRNGTMTVNFTGATAQVMTLTGSGVTPFLVNPHTLDFTAVVGGTSVEKGVGIGNRLFTSEGYTFTLTGDFTIAQNPCPNPMPPNGTTGCSPTIVFQPKTPGPQQGALTIGYAGITEQDVVTLNGIGSTVQVSPLRLSFPLTDIGTTATLDVTLSNSGAAAVGITSVSGASDPFSENDTCQGQVPAGGSCILHVVFAPQTTNPSTGTMNIALADGAQYAVALSGTGTGPVITIVTPAGTTFPDQAVGTTSNSPLTVSVINNGNAPLNISSISMSGDFSQTNDCPASLVSTCFINVKFSPKATGLSTGTLTLTDDGFGSPQTIQFSGNGTDFQVSAAGGSLSATVVAGQTATYNLNVTAVGSFSGQIDFACAGAPPGGACHLSAPSLNVIGSVPVPLTVTVSTAPNTSAALAPEQLYLSGMNLLAGMLLLPFVLAWKRARKTMARQCLLIFISLGIFLAIAGCGGGQTAAPPPPLTQGGTPSGTYTITLTSTDQTVNGPVMHQTNLTLVVQ